MTGKSVDALLLILLPTIIFSQWSSKTVQDPFDGEIIYATGVGQGGRYPYKNPVLYFRQKGGVNDLILDNAGSLICGNPTVEFSFGDANNVMNFSLTPSNDNDAGFFNLDEVYKITSLIKELKQNSMAFVRFSTDCSTNRFKLSLNGSSKAISKIFSEEFIKKGELAKVNMLRLDKIKSEKLARGKEFAENFFAQQNITFSEWDWEKIYRELEFVMEERGLELTEIIIEQAYKNGLMPDAIKPKLGFESIHYRKTSLLIKLPNLQ